MAAEQVLDYQDAILYATDVRLITPPNWLNDNCINVYLRLLEHEDFADRRDLLFMDPAVVSCMMIQCTDEEDLRELAEGIQAESRRAVFIPVNDSEEFFSGCTHWSLLVYDAKRRAFMHFDSSGGRNGKAAAATAAKFWALLAQTGSPAVEAAECPQQANSYDCGAYVLAMTRQLAHTLVTEGRLDPSSLPGFVTPDAVTELRRRLAAKVQELIEAYRAQKGRV